MKITDIRIDGFGVWNDLKLSGLSPRVTTFFGANEAGKTTLMQFTRSVLYGMSPERRHKYLPPVNGGLPGGSLGLVDDQQRFDVSRIADRGADDVGLVRVSTAGGEVSGDRLLRESLNDIDEATYTNIFAIGLSEIQTLGTLSGSQAAEWLYRLTSGLDRVSLYDVIQNLRQTRLDLLNSNDRESKISKLVARREVLRGEIQQLSQRNRQWAQLSVRIQELDGQIAQQENIVRDCQHQARTIEIAVGLKPNWRKRVKFASQIKAYDGTIQIPDDGLERLDKLNRKIEEHQREADILKGQRQQLKEESDRLKVNQQLVKNACRIDALGEQRDWLQSLERQIEELETEAGEFEQRLENEQERLGRALGVADSEHLQVISKADIESLQPHVKDLRRAQKQVEQAQQDVDALAESERSLKVKVESAIIGGESHGLPMDVREASDLVANLRSRLKVEQRIEQARNHEMDLEQQSHDLLDDQVIPMTTFNWMLAGVILSGLALGAHFLLPASPFGTAGWLAIICSLFMVGFAFFFKFITEDAAADKLDSCQRQLETVARQIKEAERDKDKLDAGLPMTDGSVLIRLQAAERHLAELENVLPVEAQRKQAGHEVTTAQSRLSEAKANLQKVL
ncbi:MAG: AAA family ATPase, partial [Planctomycetota bacterium]